MIKKNIQKKKIIFILPLLCAGGAERALITLMNNLDRDKFAPEMIALNDEGPLKDWIHKDIPFHDLGGVRVSRAFFKLRKKLKELQPDIVMTTMAHSNFLLMSLKLFFPKIKFIIREAVIPSSIIKEHRNKSFFIKALYRFFYPMANIVVSPSQDIIDEFGSIIGLNTKNHTVIYNQVDTQAISNSLRNIDFPECKNDTIRFVCAGRLHYQKGYDRLIKSLKGFSPQNPWKLVILGEGKERENLEKLIENNGLSENIKLQGNTSEPWKIMGAADYLLLPSRWEGMPNVVLESLASGTPVIASCDANGIREIEKNSQSQSLLIAENMDEFVNLMAAVAPRNKKTPGPSMLPNVFQTKTIMSKFEKLLLV